MSLESSKAGQKGLVASFLMINGSQRKNVDVFLEQVLFLRVHQVINQIFGLIITLAR